MNETMNETNPSEDKSLSLTLVALAVAAILAVGTQLRVAAIEKPMLEAQLNASAQRLTATKSAQVQAEEALQKREEQVKSLSETEAKYAAFLTELLELAKTDPDAKAVTQKWKIQQQGAPANDSPAVSQPEAKPAKAAPAGSSKQKAQ
jgi:hypothetical protein